MIDPESGELVKPGRFRQVFGRVFSPPEPKPDEQLACYHCGGVLEPAVLSGDQPGDPDVEVLRCPNQCETAVTVVTVCHE